MLNILNIHFQFNILFLYTYNAIITLNLQRLKADLSVIIYHNYYIIYNKLYNNNNEYNIK